MKDRLLKLIMIVGGANNLALLLGVKRQRIYQWIYTGRISKSGYLLVRTSRIIPASYAKGLRPDLDNLEIDQPGALDSIMTELASQRDYEAKIENGADHSIPIIALDKGA